MDRFPDWQLLVAGTATGYGEQGGYLEEMKLLAAVLAILIVSLGTAAVAHGGGPEFKGTVKELSESSLTEDGESTPMRWV